MKRKIFKYISITFLIIFVICSMVGCQTTTRNFGGTTTLKLEPNRKLEEITWKDDSLWYLTRPMRDDEEPEVHIFKESDSLGILEGTVKVIESRE